MTKEKSKNPGRVRGVINILGQLVINWRGNNSEGVRILDKEDIDKMFQEETNKSKKPGSGERTNLE